MALVKSATLSVFVNPVDTAPAGDPYEAIVSFAMPANVDTVIVDGCVLRQREHIDGFDVLGRAVREDLSDCNAGEETADAGANIGA